MLKQYATGLTKDKKKPKEKYSRQLSERKNSNKIISDLYQQPSICKTSVIIIALL